MRSIDVDSLFKRAIVTSGIVNETQWDYCLRLLRHRMVSESIIKGSVAEDRVLKAILVEQGALTEYQADQLMEGRHQLHFGRIFITDFIGQGGMGQVFKAIHQILGRKSRNQSTPATKVRSGCDRQRRVHAREIQLQAELDSKYLVRAYDAGKIAKCIIWSRNMFRGMDLSKLVKSQGAFSKSSSPNHYASGIGTRLLTPTRHGASRCQTRKHPCYTRGTRESFRCRSSCKFPSIPQPLVFDTVERTEAIFYSLKSGMICVVGKILGRPTISLPNKSKHPWRSALSAMCIR